jgi:hypothetical protein
MLVWLLLGCNLGPSHKPEKASNGLRSLNGQVSGELPASAGASSEKTRNGSKSGLSSRALPVAVGAPVGPSAGRGGQNSYVSGNFAQARKQNTEYVRRGGLLMPVFDSDSGRESPLRAHDGQGSVLGGRGAPSGVGDGGDAQGRGGQGREESTWTTIETIIGSGAQGAVADADAWKAAAGAITFQAEPAALHGAQAMVHTLLATEVELKDVDVSWVTQLTLDRLPLLREALARWHGPASVTLYVRDLPRALKLIYPLRAAVDVHMVLADLHEGRVYPVNTLRNVAINKCRTAWMALVDADFVPNAELYPQLLEHVNALPAPEGDGRDGRQVYVLPAFQLNKDKRAAAVPTTKQDLLRMGDRVSQVHPEAGRDIAHKPTDYAKWRTATEPYAVRYQMPYEPYYVANKRIPRYNATFVGYGNDKTSQCYELWRAGFRYVVLPYAFVFHMDHPRGEWLTTDTEWMLRGPRTLEEFISQVDDRYRGASSGADGTGGRAEVGAAAINASVSEVGKDCFSACEAAGLECLGTKIDTVNTCAAMQAAYGVATCPECSSDFYGHDLPAYNQGMRKCLLNNKPEAFPLSCAATQPSSRRLCPCGAPLSEWLTPKWVHAFKVQHKLYGGEV